MSELDLTNIASSSISTPASGATALFTDLDKKIKSKDDTGKVNSLGDFNNFSTASQSPTAATRTYITGSQVAVPAGKLQIGTMVRWTFNMTKTAAGTASSTFDVAFGTAGTTSDTARLSFTKPAGTAIADEGKVVIEMTVRGPLSASGIVVGEFSMIHNLAATGHATIPCVVVNIVSSAFDVTTPTFVGVCITSGASDAITIQQVITEVFNL
jgi:hypothetical protein